MTNPAENLNMFLDTNEEYLVAGTEEDNIPTSEIEDKITEHVIPDERESVRKKSNSSEFTYHKKDSNTYKSAYDRVLNVPKKLDILYGPSMPSMH